MSTLENMRCTIGCRNISLPRLLWRIALFVSAGTHQPVDSYLPRALHPSMLTPSHRNIPTPSLATRHRDARKGENRSSGSNRRDNDPHHPKNKCDGTDNTKLLVTSETTETIDRRSLMISVLVGGCSSMAVKEFPLPLEFRIGDAFVSKAAAAEISETMGDENATTRKPPGKLTDRIVQSLVFEKVLGAGSYKTVYLVSATIPAPPNEENNGVSGSMQTVRYALAVERLRTKRDVKNAFRGIRIPEMIQQGLNDNGNDEELFETIVDWWIQPSDLPEFEKGQRLFPDAGKGAGTDKALGRTRSEPKKNFVGSRYMLSFKPVYDSDFKRFIRDSPVLVPVGVASGADKHQRAKSAASVVSVSVSDYWTEPVVMAFVLEILRAGRIMHEAGVVHRDIKPKNMMIYTVPTPSGGFRKRPVIIDYGYSEFGSPLLLEAGSNNAPEKKKDVCVVRPGQLKGEVDYVLAQDLGEYRGCQRGDAYAMGKTIYEFVFGGSSADPQSQSKRRQQQQQQEDRGGAAISVEGAEIQNRAFKNLLLLTNASNDSATAGRVVVSRFPLSRGAADSLLTIIRGLCGPVLDDGTPVLSFAEAEAILSDYLSR